MQATYTTERLFLRNLKADDNAFIFELLNTPGWIKFIGDRNIKTSEDADKYIQKITGNPDINYRVVTLQQDKTAIGLVTLIKRNYLDHPDIGFAFLPAYNRQGYAFEATNTVLHDLLKKSAYSTVLATTIPENNASIHLLKNLGFSFSKEITNEGEQLHVFTITKDELQDHALLTFMTHFIRTDSDNTDFKNLVALLDADLKIRDGEEHAFYAQFNKITTIRNAVVCYVDDKAIGCGAFKPYDESKAEIKRMFVLPGYRGHGIAMKILKELELWAAEFNYSEYILETGKKQPEAIRLYQKAGYSIIPCYGQYLHVENSVCMKKTVI